MRFRVFQGLFRPGDIVRAPSTLPGGGADDRESFPKSLPGIQWRGDDLARENCAGCGLGRITPQGTSVSSKGSRR
jgi:hypothetical protein